MLEGLEATEVRLSDMYIDNEKYRWDSNFFKKEYIKAYNRIKRIPHSQIGNEIEVLTDFHSNGSYESIAKVFKLLDTRDYAYMVRTTDLEQQNYEENVKYVSKETYDFLAKSKVFGGEVIINKIGSPGRTFLMPSLNCPVTLGMNLFMLKLKQDASINNVALFLFLNTDIGRLIIERKINGTVPLTIDKEAIRSVYTPRFAHQFLEELSQMLASVENTQKESHSLYSSAESYLLECLGMQDFVANPDAYNVKTLKESFLESGRIDAEYYLPKYEDYINVVSAYAGGSAPLGKVCTIKDSNYTPEHGVKYRYIELADIGRSGDITGCSYENGEDLPTRARRVIAQGDVIVSSIEGSLNSCALVTDDYDQSLCSTGFYVVRSSLINAETLLTLFKSFPIQQLLKKGCSGTILTCISKQEFENIPIPLIRPEMQEEIAKHVRRSFALRKEASELLKKAKLSVEHATETGGGVNS